MAVDREFVYIVGRRYFVWTWALSPAGRPHRPSRVEEQVRQWNKKLSYLNEMLIFLWFDLEESPHLELECDGSGKHLRGSRSSGLVVVSGNYAYDYVEAPMVLMLNCIGASGGPVVLNSCNVVADLLCWL